MSPICARSGGGKEMGRWARLENQRPSARSSGEGIVPTEDGDEHTEGVRDGDDPRIVRGRGIGAATAAVVSEPRYSNEGVGICRLPRFLKGERAISHIGR